MYICYYLPRHSRGGHYYTFNRTVYNWSQDYCHTVKAISTNKVSHLTGRQLLPWLHCCVKALNLRINKWTYWRSMYIHNVVLQAKNKSGPLAMSDWQKAAESMVPSVPTKRKAPTSSSKPNPQKKYYHTHLMLKNRRQGNNCSATFNPLVFPLQPAAHATMALQSCVHSRGPLQRWHAPRPDHSFTLAGIKSTILYFICRHHTRWW